MLTVSSYTHTNSSSQIIRHIDTSGYSSEFHLIFHLSFRRDRRQKPLVRGKCGELNCQGGKSNFEAKTKYVINMPYNQIGPLVRGNLDSRKKLDETQRKWVLESLRSQFLVMGANGLSMNRDTCLAKAGRTIRD